MPQCKPRTILHGQMLQIDARQRIALIQILTDQIEIGQIQIIEIDVAFCRGVPVHILPEEAAVAEFQHSDIDWRRL
ncbi:hypothetical protein DSECCO2_637820 [anaerobic digester metagenome]